MEKEPTTTTTEGTQIIRTKPTILKQGALVQGKDFKMPEKRQLEQYFFSAEVLDLFMEAFENVEKIVCLTTPTLGDAFWKKKKKKVTVLDIDDRFSYLPGYEYFDIFKPHKLEFIPDLIVLDPPFFQLTAYDLAKAVEVICQGSKEVKIVIGYLIRLERDLFQAFRPFNIQVTKFPLAYQTVKEQQCQNCKLYANADFPKIKRILAKKVKKKGNRYIPGTKKQKGRKQ